MTQSPDRRLLTEVTGVPRAELPTILADATAPKADISYVDAQVAARTTPADVDAQIAAGVVNKANTADLNTVSGRVSAVETEVSGRLSDTSLSSTYDRRGVAAVRHRPPLLIAQPDVMSTPPTFAVSGPGGASPINAGAPTQIAYNDARITHLGQINTTVNQFSTNYLQNTVSAAWTPPVCADEFDHYGDDLALRFRAHQSNTAQFWVWVDGKPATAAPVVMSSNTSGGSLSFYRITFASVALRRIRIYRYLADFGGIDIKPTHAIAPTPRNAPRLFVLGDSYIEGTGATTAMTGLATTTGRLLGMETFVGGQGGTGYVNNAGTAGKAVFGDSARLAKVVAAAPDYVLVFGSQNDDGLTGIQSAAAALYASLASSLPGTKLIVVGPPSLSSTVTTNRAANRDAVKAAALAAPNVLGFIDPNNDAQGLTWVTGTGNTGAPAGNGSADVFAASGAVAGHPTQAGHDYYARRIVEAAAALIAAA